jgi:glycine C-acetyltransferase
MLVLDDREVSAERDAGEATVETLAEPPRNRDLVVGSTRTRALFTSYEWLVSTGHRPMLGRSSDRTPGRFVHAALAVDSLAPLPTPEQHTRLLHFGSYNYSGLNGHPEVVAAARDALDRYGTTTSGVRLLNGTTDLHLQLERRLAAFLGFADAVTYSSGFAANVAVLAAVCSDKDVVLVDELSHQSIHDGLKLAGATVIKYPHNDMAALRGAIEGHARLQRKLIVTDGVFSMDGDLAPLDEIVRLANRHNAFVIVDDAHATAAVGPCGRGTPALFGLAGEIDILTGSLSKGLPGIGGFAAGSKRTMDLLRVGSNAYIFSASLPAPIVAGLLAAIDVLERHPEIAERLHANEARLRDGIRGLGLDVLTSETPIIPIRMPNRDTTYRFAQRLHHEGIFANPVIFPAVSRRLPRIRLNASAALEPEDVDRALEAIERAARALELPRGAKVP